MYRATVPSTVWNGGFYLRHPEVHPQRVRVQLQNHEPASALYLNGNLLGYLPVKDWIYAWHSASFDVPRDVLTAGYNQLSIRTGRAAPKLRTAELNWDEVVFRGAFLDEGRGEWHG